MEKMSEEEETSQNHYYHALWEIASEGKLAEKAWPTVYAQLEDSISIRIMEATGKGTQDDAALRSSDILVEFKPDDKELKLARGQYHYRKLLSKERETKEDDWPEVFAEIEDSIYHKLESNPEDYSALASLDILNQHKQEGVGLSKARIKIQYQKYNIMGILVNEDGLPIAAFPETEEEQLQLTVSLILNCIDKFKQVTKKDVYIFQRGNEIYEILIPDGATHLKYDELVKMKPKSLEKFVSKHEHAILVPGFNTPIKYAIDDPESLGTYASAIKLRDAVFNSFRLNEGETFQYAFYCPAEQTFKYETNTRLVSFVAIESGDKLFVASTKTKPDPTKPAS